MYKREEKDIEFERNVNSDRKNLILTFKKNFDIQNNTLNLFLKGLNHAKINNFDNTKLLWNLAGFINIISFDLKVVGKDLTLAETQWEKKYYARQSCLLIYESINDLFDLLGNDFKNILSTKLNAEEVDEFLLEARKDLNLYKKDYFEKLKEIRNNSIAHRDNDIINQLDIIFNLSWFETIVMVTDFDKILNKLGSVMQKVINQALIDLEELKNQKIDYKKV